MNVFVSKTMLLTRKDLQLELRARDTLPPMLAFALAVTLLLAFTLPASTTGRGDLRIPFGTVAVVDVVAGFTWIVVLFAGLIGFARTFQVEREDGAIDALLLLPLDRAAVFASKAVANLAYVGLVQLLVLPLVVLMFDVSVGSRWISLLAIAALADIGFVAIGTLLAAVAAQTRSSELMLPILALPTLVPLFIAAGELTADVYAGGSLADVAARGWFALLVAFDIVYVTLGAVLFDQVIE